MEHARQQSVAGRSGPAAPRSDEARAAPCGGLSERVPALRRSAGWLAGWAALWGRLTRRRRQLGWSQEELARSIGRSGRTLRRCEAGKPDLSAPQLFQLADRLGFDIVLVPRPAVAAPALPPGDEPDSLEEIGDAPGSREIGCR